MARYKGTFTVAANYEPLIAAPFDARQLVESRSDLINPKTWNRSDGTNWTYVGMMVSVSRDIEESYNGIYVLIADDFTQLSNWRKCADDRDVKRLLEEIAALEVGAGGQDIEIDSIDDLPEIGDENATYYVKQNLSIQRWDEETHSYISYGASGESPDLDIRLIIGGNANGND